LNVYAGTNDSLLYEDAGEGYDYLKKEFRIGQFQSNSSKGKFLFTQTVKGNLKPDYKNIKITVYGLNFKVQSCLTDKKAIPFSQNKEQVTLSVPAEFEQIQLLAD